MCNLLVDPNVTYAVCHQHAPEAEDNKSKVTMITAVAKKKEDPTITKGELMLSNMDAMEVCVYLSLLW